MSSKGSRKRLDELLVDRGFAETTSEAKSLIMAGEVYVKESVIDKAGTMLPPDAAIRLKERLPYVSRGGLKLAAALDRFTFDVSGKICADVGSSTGGFTDVLLRRGAAKVYAIDSAYGELDFRLRKDARVVVMERTSVANVKNLPDEIETAVIDVSLVPLKIVLSFVQCWIADEADVVALVKPQYEAGAGKLPKGAVVRDPAVHKEILQRVIQDLRELPFALLGLIASPIRGQNGNREFLIWLKKNSRAGLSIEAAEKAVEAAIAAQVS